MLDESSSSMTATSGLANGLFVDRVHLIYCITHRCDNWPCVSVKTDPDGAPVFTLITMWYIEKDIVDLVPKKGIIGKEFRKEAKQVIEALTNLNSDDVTAVETAISDKKWENVYLFFKILMIVYCECKNKTFFSSD